MKFAHLTSKDILESAFQYAPIGKAIVAVDGSWLKVNPALCAIVGYSEEELTSALSYQDITHPSDLDESVRQALHLLKSQDCSYQLEKRYMRKDGSIVWVSLHVNLLRDPEDGEPIFYIAQTVDISERKRTEEKLRETEELFRLIADNVQDIISYSTPDGICRFVTPNVRELLGYEPEEIVGKLSVSFYHEDDVKALYERQYQNSDELTVRVRRKDGTYAWFESTIKFVRDADETLLSIMGIGRDITARKRMEKQLEASRAELLNILRYQLGVTYKFVKSGDKFVYTFIAGQTAETMGMNADKAVGHSPDELFDAELAQSERRMYERAWNGEKMTYEAFFNDATIYVSLFPVADNGTVKEVIASAIDITEKKKAERELEEAVERYNSLKRNNPDAVFSMRANGRIINVNKAATRLTDYTVEELANASFFDFLFPEHVETVVKQIEQALNGPSISDIRFAIRHKSGSRIEAVATPAPIVIRERVVGCYLIIKDMTEQLKQNELLRQTEKLSVAGQLAAGVAHEIRNPLTAIKGFLQLIAKNEGTPSRYLDIISSEMNRIEAIVTELLMLAKPQATDMRQTEMRGIVKEVADLLASEAIIHNISIQTELHSDVCLWCDPNQIKQVFVNFLKNAIEAMPGGGIIRVELTSNAYSCSVKVIDQGRGIEEDKIAKLGDPFFTTKENGTGLGLMVTKKIIENHGGQLHIGSELGVGTTVEVVFPL